MKNLDKIQLRECQVNYVSFFDVNYVLFCNQMTNKNISAYIHIISLYAYKWYTYASKLEEK